MSPDNGLLSWAARDRDGSGACGVTDEPERAAAHLRSTLERLAPGATGVVRLARLDRHAKQPVYRYGKTLVRGKRGANGIELVEE